MSPSSWETGGKFLVAARPLGSHPELSRFSCHLQDVILSQLRKQEGRRGVEPSIFESTKPNRIYVDIVIITMLNY